MCIRDRQYQVQCVGDGQSVYQCLDLYASQIRLIVLSMDIKNPDGVEVLKTLQHRIEVRDIPIIASGYWLSLIHIFAGAEWFVFPDNAGKTVFRFMQFQFLFHKAPPVLSLIHI